ncbi:membrane-associated protein, putative, partial [Bodo saltans]
MLQQPTSIVARHEVRKFARCTLFTVVAISLCLTVASQPIEIPCNTDPSVVYSVQSHRNYTLTGCFPASTGAAPGVSIAPDAAAIVGGVVVLRNISLTVAGGGVLPLLNISGSSVQMENITMLLIGVRVGPYVYNRTLQQPRSMVSMLLMSSSVATVRNLTVLLEDCVIDITSINYANTFQPSGLFQLQTISGSVEMVTVAFRHCNMSLYLRGGAVGNARAPGFVSIDFRDTSTASNVRVQFVHSSATVNGDISQAVTAISVNPAIVNFLCRSQQCVAVNVTMTSENATLAVNELFPAFALNANGLTEAVSETVSVLYFLTFDPHTINVVLKDSLIFLSSVCTGVCDMSSTASSNAGVVWFATNPVQSGRIPVNNLSDVSMVATSTTFGLAAPGKTIFLATAYAVQADIAVAEVINCSFTFNNGGQNIGSQLRMSAIVAAYNNILVTNWTIQIRNVVFMSTQESGRCLATVHAAVYFIGNVANIDVTLVSVSMATAAVNGTSALLTTIPGTPMTLLSSVSALVNFQPMAPKTGGQGSRVQITAANCVVAAEHTPRLPTGASMFAVTSLVCGTSITISLSISTITLDDVRVERQFASQSASSTWFPENAAGFRVNATAMAQFTDVTDGVPDSLAPFLAIITGGTAAPVRHTNVTVTLQGNCAVGYHSVNVAPLPTDRVGFIQFPSVAIQSSYLLHGTWYRSLLLIPGAADVGFGSLAGSTGATQLIDCNVTVRDVAAPMANLLTAFNGALQLLSSNMGRTIISFSNVTMVRSIASPNAPLLLDANQYVIGAVDGSIVVAPPPTIAVDNEFGLIALQSSPVSIENCSFVGFTSLVDAPALNLSLYNGRSQLEYFLYLGCSLWDSEAMPLSAVSSDAAVLRLVDYRACEDNMAHSATATKTEAILVSALSTINPRLFTDTSAATTSAAVAVYAAVLVPVAQARSVAGLQRAIAALHLAARCAVSTANATYADPMYSQLVDNPLGLPVAVGPDALQFAAGAAVGNALLVLAIATLMHFLQLAKSRAAG